MKEGFFLSEVVGTREMDGGLIEVCASAEFSGGG